MSLSATDVDERRNESRVKRIPQNFDASLPILKCPMVLVTKPFMELPLEKKTMELSQSGGKS